MVLYDIFSLYCDEYYNNSYVKYDWIESDYEINEEYVLSFKGILFI